MKVFVTGASGQLGFDVCHVLQSRGIEHRGVSSRELNITDESAVSDLPTDVAPGSAALCPSTGGVYIFDPAGTWTQFGG